MNCDNEKEANMKQLTQEELKEVKGGWSIAGIFGLGTLFTFIIGVVDGYLRPLNCR